MATLILDPTHAEDVFEIRNEKLENTNQWQTVKFYVDINENLIVSGPTLLLKNMKRNLDKRGIDSKLRN